MVLTLLTSLQAMLQAAFNYRDGKEAPTVTVNSYRLMRRPPSRDTYSDPETE